MINATELEKVFAECLYKSEEIPPVGPDGKQSIPEGAVLVEGVISKFGFHPERLAIAKPKVIGWLSQLPHQFHENPVSGKDGGWSFLNACVTEDGEQWGEHRSMEQLFCLGMGLGLVKCLLPREMWEMMPGAMPYYSITKEVKEQWLRDKASIEDQSLVSVGGLAEDASRQISRQNVAMKVGQFILVRADHKNTARAGKDGMVAENSGPDDESVALIFGFDRHNHAQDCECVGRELWLKSELDTSTLD